MEPDLTSLLACPACEGELQRAAAAWTCAACRRRYPVLDGVPWLFTEPDEALAEWRARLRLLLEHLRREARRHERELGRDNLGDLTRRRLSLLARAYGACLRRREGA